MSYKKIIGIGVWLITASILSYSQDTSQHLFKKLGRDRVLELYYTQRLGESIDSLQKKKKHIPCIKEMVYKNNCVYYMFENFILVQLPNKIEQVTTEAKDISIVSNFISMDLRGNELKNEQMPQEALECIWDAEKKKKFK